FSAHLFPNGDLLSVFNGEGDTPNGYGLAKVDKDSTVLWRYSANVHHDLDVLEDGTIYGLTHQVVHELPQKLDAFVPPCLLDYFVKLSPEGKELQKIPILEAFQNSPYATLLKLLEREPRLIRRGDVMHTNFVQVLRPELAAKFPSFKAG